MTIKQKLLINAGIAVCSMIAMFSLFSWTLNKVEELGRGQTHAMALEADMLAMRRDEKDFLARLDLSYVDKFDTKIEQAQGVIAQLTAISEKYAFDVPELTQLQAKFQHYQDDFHQVVLLQQKIGLDHNSGLRGALRTSVHEVESLLKDSEGNLDYDHLLVDVLQLRRTEKDFMLRSEAKYLDQFNRQIQTLQDDLVAYGFNEVIMASAEQYKKQFLNYASARQALGLDSKSGQQLEMRNAVRDTEALLDTTLLKVTRELEDSLTESRWIVTVLFIGVLVVALASSVMIGRSIFRPIQQIRQDVLLIDQNQDLNHRVSLQGNDEITQMGTALNTMLAGFQKVIVQVNQAVAQMNETTDLLSQNATRTSEDVNRQTHETDMVASAITEMVSTIEEIARSTEFMAERANATHKNALHGQEQVQSAIDRIHTMSDRLEGSVSSVTELAEQSQTIGNVLDVIQDIADQTNLLALNAAIEAARAGDQGRGFAVVADEVRALAGRTCDATREIAEIITSLQSKTESIVSLIHASRKDGSASREQVALTEQALTGITADVINISDRATQVAAAIEQQSSVANEVGQNVIVIRDITADAAEAAKRNAKASQEIALQAGQLFDVVSTFKV